MPVVANTGPLVAFFDRAERHHRWAIERIEQMESPLLVREPVLAETMYMLGGHAKAQDALWDFMGNGALDVAFRIGERVSALRKLMYKHRDTPMSLADACLVRMAEIHEDHAIMTLDPDFLIYRKHGRTPLAPIRPDGLPS